MSSAAKNSATALVGDIGGTNARFALADVSGPTPVISDIRDFPSQSYRSGNELVRAYLAQAPKAPELAAIAAAGPIVHGKVKLTNLGYSLSEAEFSELGFQRARLLNDFESLALATQHLGPNDVHTLGGPATGEASATVAVIGPGTGFGASARVCSRGLAVAVAGEGGHASFAPGDEIEQEILRILSHKFRHVSIERVLSGPGLQNLHAALNEIEGVAEEKLPPSEITRRALAGDAGCERTVRRFCAILGSVAGDFALCYGALGGLFIAGGVVPTILPLLEKSEFRARFEAKGRFHAYLSAIPTHVILQSHAAFLGAAELAHQLIST